MARSIAAVRRFDGSVDLCFDISVIASAPVEGDPGTYITGVPGTNSELEAELDRIESEIYFTLTKATTGATINLAKPGATPIIRTLWRALTGNMITDPRSTPHRNSEEGARLAMRSLIWKVQVPDDQFEALPLGPLVGLDRLPDPLRSIAGELLETSYGASIAAALSITMPTMPKAVPLNDVTLGAEIVRPGQRAAGTPNVNGDAPLSGVGPTPTPAPTDSKSLKNPRGELSHERFRQAAADR